MCLFKRRPRGALPPLGAPPGSQTTSWCFMASPDHDVSGRDGDVGPHRHLEDQTDHLLFFCHLSSSVAKRYSHASWSLRSPCGIWLLCAKHLFAAARNVWHRRQSSRGERDRDGLSSRCSLTRHLNRSLDGVFEIVRVVGRGLVSIARSIWLAGASCLRETVIGQRKQ